MKAIAVHLTQQRVIMIPLLCLFFLLAAFSAAWSAEPAPEHDLTAQDVQALVAEALTAEGAADAVDATLTGRNTATLYRGTAPLSIAIETLDFDATSHKWDAMVGIYEGDKQVEKMVLTGRYDPLINVPVLTRRLHSSDVIEASDIQWLPMPEHRLRKDTVLTESALLGFAPKRVISEGKPIRADEIARPNVMKKGDQVQISFRTPSMEIRTLAVAMQDGGVGDAIRFRNSASELVIQATITGAGEAEIKPLTQLSLNQQ